MSADQIAQVRRFNRLVTQRAGALDDHFLGSDRPLGESRVLYEIGAGGADLRTLRARLGLDSGYLSRVVQSLESQGLIKVRSAADDERVRRAELTRAGRAELKVMNRRSDEAAEAVLSPLTDSQRERLVAAMGEVHRLLQAAGIIIERVDPASETARWCVAQYFAELDSRFEEGYDLTKALPADDAEQRPPRGAFLVATVDGEAVACGCIKTSAPRVGWIKRMWVASSARGLGLGRRMLTALENQARELGLTTVQLETNRRLVEAIQLYRSAGYVEVAPFNTEPYGDYWFEKRLSPTA
jgi:DNA-binding MarR family transcriptional regulator